MNKWLSRYLKARSCVAFMANPVFYIVFYITGFMLLDDATIIGDFVRAIWGLMKDISSNVFLAGTGSAQKDLHVMLTILLPSFIALSWWLIEKVTGFQGYLERRGLIS